MNLTFPCWRYEPGTKFWAQQLLTMIMRVVGQVFSIHLHAMGNNNIFIFSTQAFNEFSDFATVHSLMNDTNLFGSCQANLPLQYASNIELIRQIDS